MNYEFPNITNISDVLPAIEGRDEFVVAVKEGYTVLNYNVVMSDTFPSIKVAGGSAKMREERSRHNALRRECRGMIFCNETGNIIRRPYHKFFNVNERDETQEKVINLSDPHVILEKLDGSMIAPFKVGRKIIWGTKMGATTVAEPVEAYLNAAGDLGTNYELFAMLCIDAGDTPIFEWCSRKQRIVLDYAEDQLVLTAIRNTRTGKYAPYITLTKYAEMFGLPVVRAFEPQTNMGEFLEYTRDLQDLEGFVVRFDDGHMLKLKCHWYVQIHKAKEAILQDRNIVELIIENKLDDIKAHLSEDERGNLGIFEEKISTKLLYLTSKIHGLTYHYTEVLKVDRKTFALEHAESVDPFMKPLIFQLWDGNAPERAHSLVLNTIRNRLTRNTNWAEIRDAWFDGVKYNA